MTIKDLLSSPYMDEAIRANVSDWNDPDLAFKAFKIWIDELKAMDPDKEGQKHICIPIQFKDGLEGPVITSWDAAIFHKDELDRYQPDKKLASVDMTCMTDKEVEAFLDSQNYEDRLTSYAFEFSPWSTWLGIEVFDGALTDENTAEVLTYIIGEMSFNGITEESQEERRSELEASMEETEKLMSLREEEREKRLIPFEKVKAEMEEKYGLIDKRTPEEKEENRRRFNRTGLWNMISKEKALIAYKKAERK